MISLKSFIIGSSDPNKFTPGCADLDRHRPGDCFRHGTCVVMDGQSCLYFEKAVLPTAAETGKIMEMTALYEAKVGKMARPTKGMARADQRLCDCGAPLAPKRRYCEKCRKRRARETYKLSKRRSRHSVQS